jgi:hypothetical protein
LLLSLFLFNVGGYYFLFWGLRERVNVQLTDKLDNGNYRETETVELKIRIQLPYVPSSNDFNRVKGKFEYNGNFYHLVKQKLQNDTLYIVCIPDQKEKRLVTAMTDYARLANELPDESKKAFNFLSKLLKEFRSTTTLTTISIEGWTSELGYISTIDSTLDPVRSIVAPPPKHG